MPFEKGGCGQDSLVSKDLPPTMGCFVSLQIYYQNEHVALKIGKRTQFRVTEIRREN